MCKKVGKNGVGLERWDSCLLDHFSHPFLPFNRCITNKQRRVLPANNYLSCFHSSIPSFPGSPVLTTGSTRCITGPMGRSNALKAARPLPLKMTRFFFHHIQSPMILKWHFCCPGQSLHTYDMKVNIRIWHVTPISLFSCENYKRFHIFPP